MGPTSNPRPLLAYHLTTPTLTPLHSSCSSSSTPSRHFQSSPSPTSSLSSIGPDTSNQQDALTILTAASLTAYTTSTRLGLGLPQRIMVETTRTPWAPGRGGSGTIKTERGPVLLQSFLNPEPRRQTKGGNGGSSGAHQEAGGRLLRTSEDADDENTTLANSLTSDSDAGKGKSVVGYDDMHGASSSTQPSNADVDQQDQDEELEPEILPPLLIATVVAPGYDQIREARRAVAGLEKLGREMQRRWVVDEVRAVAEGENGGGSGD